MHPLTVSCTTTSADRELRTILNLHEDYIFLVD